MTTSTLPATQTEPLFREEQRFRGVLEWACVAGGFVSALLPVTLPLYARFVRDGESWAAVWADKGMAGLAVISGLVVISMMGIAALLARARLIVEVRPGMLRVRFRTLFINREVPLTEIERAEAVTYDPMKDYGGWGVRSGPEGNAYNVSGDRGVRLTFTRNEMPLLLGSQHADALATAIRRARAGHEF